MIKKCLILLCFMWSMSSHAQLTIEITQGIASSIPISVVPIGLQGKKALPEDVMAIIHADLERSGHFSVLDPDDMLSQPASEEDLYFRDWRLLKQEYVVIAKAQLVGPNKYKIRYQLFDVFNERELLSQVLTGNVKQLRDMAHSMSDAIYEQLTGIRGAFSTKIAYVTTNKKRTRFSLSIADSDGAREKVVLKSKYSIFSPSCTRLSNNLLPSSSALA